MPAIETFGNHSNAATTVNWPSGLFAGQVSAAEAKLSRHIGSGCKIPWPGIGATLSLQLMGESADGSWNDAMVFSGAFGAIECGQGARLLRALTGVDPSAVAATDGAGRSWLLSAAIGRLEDTALSCVQHAEPGRLPAQRGGVTLRVVLRNGHHAVVTQARGEADAWLRFLSHAPWTHLRRPVSEFDNVGLDLPVVLAQHTLPTSALKNLAPGDIILPGAPRFGCDGDGYLAFGGRLISVRYAAPSLFKIISMENTMESATMDAMHRNMEDDMQEETGAQPAADTANPALDSMLVTLDFLFGNVRMTFGDMRRLAVGTVIPVKGATPASIAIVSGGKEVGRGEVVSVNGQLGIRCTQWGPMP